MAEHNRNQSNQFNEDWDQNRNRNDQHDDNFNRDNYGNYGTIGFGGDYGRRSGSYDQGSASRRNEKWSQGNNQNTGSYGNQNREDNNRNYNQGNGNSYGRAREDWQRGNSGYGSSGGDYNRNKQGSRYGGDTSNYGNANQGGFDRDWWDRTTDEVSSWFGDDDAARRRKMDEQRTGEHRGKGPKNYKRSEDRILEDVCDRLSDDDRLDATHIDVKIQGDEVILTGSVNDREQKRRAEDLVERVSGIRNVENRLRVGNHNQDSTRDNMSGSLSGGM